MTINGKQLYDILTGGTSSVFSLRQVSVLMREELGWRDLEANHVYIINIGPSDGEGTHWTVLLTNSNETPDMIYVDSFGAPPPDEVYKLARRAIMPSKIRMAMNAYVIQDTASTNCGYFACACALHCMAAMLSDDGKDLADAVDSYVDMFDDNTKRNDMTLYLYLQKNLPLKIKRMNPLGAFDRSQVPIKRQVTGGWKKKKAGAPANPDVSASAAPDVGTGGVDI